MAILRHARRALQTLHLDVNRYPGSDPMHRVVQLLKHNDVSRVLDVGANDGGYAADLRRFGYTQDIVSFEPLTEPRRRLLLRSKHDSRWSTESCAVGASVESVIVNVAANNGASSSILDMLPTHVRAAPTATVVGTEVVQQCSLDSIWQRITNPGDRIFLKADVQGYEREVLEGVVNHMHEIIGLQLELSLVPLYQGAWSYSEALRYASSKGYELMRIIPGFTNKETGQMLQADAIFFRGQRIQ